MDNHQGVSTKFGLKVKTQSVVDVSSLGFGEAPWPKGHRDAPSEAGVP